MRQAYEHIRKTGIAFLCLSLIVWSVMPSFTHAPSVFETIQDHMTMVEEHGHSHGFEEDLYWALHGHSHDVVDHDHNQVLLLTGTSSVLKVDFRENWQGLISTLSPSRQFLIERPPRA